MKSARRAIFPLLALLLVGCAPPRTSNSSATATSGPSASLTEQIDEAAEAATRFLIARQAPPGVWRSDVYGPFKAGDALTPLVLLALQSEAEASGGMKLSDPARAALAAGRKYLAEQVAPDGTIAAEHLAYPNYAAALAVRVLAGQPEYDKPRAAWLAFLRARQMTESLGWTSADQQYGGWGYASDPPRKPADVKLLSPLTEPNLSATVHALLAMCSAGVESDAPEFQAALQFVRRCQNFSPEESGNEADDGGFFFTLDDPVRNKAGQLNEADEQSRFASYGSATCDGLLALLLGSDSADQQRIDAAWIWLERNFTAAKFTIAQHPGHYLPDREPARDSVFFYYCESLAEVLQSVHNQPEFEALDTRRWASSLTTELLARQRDDGSWINAAVDVREDDPLVATSLALRTLALCRNLLTATGK